MATVISGGCDHCASVQHLAANGQFFTDTADPLHLSVLSVLSATKAIHAIPVRDASCPGSAGTSPMWVRVFPCGCEFSNLHFSDKMKSRRHKRGGCKFSHPMWVRVFQLAHAPDKMKSCRHKRRGCTFPMWVRVFQLAHAPDKMKSCRHKRRGCTSPMWVRVSNLHFPDKMKSRRHTKNSVVAGHTKSSDCLFSGLYGRASGGPSSILLKSRLSPPPHSATLRPL